MKNTHFFRHRARYTLLHSLALASLCAAGLTAKTVGETDYHFFLVTSFNPDYPLASTSVFDINNSNLGLGSDTFGAFTWTEDDGKIQLPWSGINSLNNLGWVNYGNSLYLPETGDEVSIPAPSGGYPLRTLLALNDNMVGVGVSSTGGSGCEPFNCPYDCGRNFVWDEVNGSYHINVPDLKAFHAVNNSNVAVGVIIINCDDNRGVVYDLNTDEMTNLSDLLPPRQFGPAQVWPTDINDLGQVIGTATYGSEPQKAFVWTEADGFTFLPNIPGGEYGYMHVNSINNNGEIVGDALDDTVLDWKAFIWDPVNGIRLLEDLVEESTNFMLENAYAINDNGWIAGSGHFGPGWATQRGYVLKRLDPPAVPGDIDGDGVVDFDDFTALLAAWGTCDGCPADFDGDGDVDFDDFTTLLANWS